MAKIYVANVTRQNQLVHYRTDFFPPEGGGRRKFAPAKSQMIAPGQQVPLGGDMPIDSITQIIDQLTPRGMYGTVDLKRLDPRKKVFYLFSLDKRIERRQIEEAWAHNRAVLTADGKRRRSAAAVAANDALLNSIQQMNDPVKPPTDFSVEYEQLEQTDNGEDRIEQGIRVVNDEFAHGGPPPSGPAPRAKAPSKPRRKAA